MKTRYSVQSIAEVLISELGKLEKSANQIKDAVNQAEHITLKIDDRESQSFQKEYLLQLNQLFKEQNNYLSKYKVVPVWLYITTVACCIITILAIYFGVSQYHQKQELMKIKTELNK